MYGLHSSPGPVPIEVRLHSARKGLVIQIAAAASPVAAYSRRSLKRSMDQNGRMCKSTPIRSRPPCGNSRVGGSVPGLHHLFEHERNASAFQAHVRGIGAQRRDLAREVRFEGICRRILRQHSRRRCHHGVIVGSWSAKQAPGDIGSKSGCQSRANSTPCIRPQVIRGDVGRTLSMKLEVSGRRCGFGA